MSKVVGADIPDEQLVDAYARGMNPREIGALVGLSHQGVRDRLAASGVELRDHAQTAALRRRLVLEEHGDEIRDTFLRALSVEQTAKKVGVSLADVKEHLSDPAVLPEDVPSSVELR